MKPYIVIGPLVRFGVGTVLGLSALQIDGRRHALADIHERGRGLLTALVMSEVEFKTGEVVGLDRDLSRTEEIVLKPVPRARRPEGDKPPKSTKAAAAANEGGGGEANEGGGGEASEAPATDDGGDGERGAGTPASGAAG